MSIKEVFSRPLYRKLQSIADASGKPVVMVRPGNSVAAAQLPFLVCCSCGERLEWQFRQFVGWAECRCGSKYRARPYSWWFGPASEKGVG